MDCERRLVMLIDDDVDMLFVTEGLLQAAGYRVITASDGQTALDLLVEGALAPAAIVLDLVMPAPSGWVVWDWLQESHLKHVPIVVWTASGVTPGAVGAARVFDKGSHPTILVDALAEVIADASRSPAPGDTPTHGVRIARPRAARLPGQQLSVLLVDDHPDMLEATQAYLERAGCAVDVALDGRAAVDVLLGGLKPDVIVLDLMMPVMDGWNLRTWLHASSAFGRVPLVVYTSSTDHGLTDTANVIAKGSPPSLLLAAVREAASGHR